MKSKDTLFAGTWNYHERLDGQVGVITAWIKSSHLSLKSQAKFDRSLDQLKQLPKTSWSKPQPASSLGNNIYVIRFTDVNNSQLRVFGHFYDAEHTFVMTLHGYEKDYEYYPRSYEKMAKGYQAKCDKDFPGTTVPFGDYCAFCKQGRSSHNS